MTNFLKALYLAW